MTNDGLHADAGFGSIARVVFRKWEKLRLLYNLLLFLMVVGIATVEPHTHPTVSAVSTALKMVLYAIGANVCYLAGPAVETYAAWLGYKVRWITIALFIGGVAISFPLVLVCAIHAFWGDLIPIMD